MVININDIPDILIIVGLAFAFFFVLSGISFLFINRSMLEILILECIGLSMFICTVGYVWKIKKRL